MIRPARLGDTPQCDVSHICSSLLLNYQHGLHRTFNAGIVNAVANHAAVRPFVGGLGVLDMTVAIADADNVALFGAHGGFVYEWAGPGIYEVHTLILPEGRGVWALDGARQSLDTMAKEHGAALIWTRIRRDYRHVRMFAHAAGMRYTGSKEFNLGDGLHSYDLMIWRP